MFRTLQAAHDAASAGDIIYIEPSYINYGNLICTKTLRIIGNGYEQTTNTGIIQPWDKRVSIFSNLTVRNTSTGTTFEGIYISTSGNIVIEAQNILFTRCKIEVTGQIQFKRRSTGENASGTKINKCRLNINAGFLFDGESTYNSATCSYTIFQVENVEINNNIGNLRIDTSQGASGGNCTSSPSYFPTAKNLSIKNNITFLGIYFYSSAGCQSCVVQNNIIQGNIYGNNATSLDGIVFGNNVCTEACGVGSNNIENTPFTSIFQGTSKDEDFRLKVGSPAIGVGLGGVDAGAFGTNDPYRVSGLAPIPQITSYSKNASSGVYTTSTPMMVTISVRGNN